MTEEELAEINRRARDPDVLVVPLPPLIGWRPIATAPKDGTEVLGTDGIGQRVIYWMTNSIMYDGWFVPGDTKGHGDGLLGWKPTHWRPLPSLPTNTVAASS